MDTILLFKKDLDTYPTNSLKVLQRHLGLSAAGRTDLVWLLAIHQAQASAPEGMSFAGSSTGRLIKAARATMNGSSASEGKDEADDNTIKPIQTFGHNVKIAVFNPDGSLIATLLGDVGPRGILIRDVQNGEVVRTLKHTIGWGHVMNITFNYDGSLIIGASSDLTAKIWNVQTGDLLHILRGHSGPVFTAVFNHDGTLAVTASIDGTAKIWDVQSGNVLQTLGAFFAQRVLGPAAAVYSAVFNNDSTLVVTASYDHTAKIWDVKSGTLLRTLENHGPVNKAVFNNAGTLVVTAADEARIWDVETGDLLQTLETEKEHAIPGRVRNAVFNDYDSLVLVTPQNGKATIWDVETGDLVHTLQDNYILSAAFNYDSSLIVTTSNNSSSAKIWDTQSGEIVQILQDPRGRQVHKAVFDRSGSLVLAIAGETAVAGGTAMVWPAGLGRMIKAARSRGTMKGAAQPSEGTAKSGPTVYLVAGAPGAGKSTSVEHLKKSGIVPQDVVDIDRDSITEDHIDFDQKLLEIHTTHGYDSDVEELEIYKMMTEAFRATKPIYKAEIEYAVDNQQDFVTYIPPFTIEEVPKGYNIVLIFIDTDPDVAYERTLLRAQGKKWLKLNTVDIYCSWNSAIKAVEKYCLTGKCYICDNRGEIKCLDFEDYRGKLPTANQAAEMCGMEIQRVTNQREQVLKKIKKQPKHDEDISSPLSEGYVDISSTSSAVEDISSPLSEGYVDISSTSSAVEAGYFD